LSEDKATSTIRAIAPTSYDLQAVLHGPATAPPSGQTTGRRSVREVASCLPREHRSDERQATQAPVGNHRFIPSTRL